MSTPEIAARIRRIQIQTTHLVEELMAGIYSSAFKGQGVEVEEVREYQQGDDIRAIDWKVTARMRSPYLKVFREERDLTMILIVDTSPSLKFGTSDQLNSDLVAEIGAVLSFSALKNHDRVGLIQFADQVVRYVPPGKGRRHVLRIIRDLVTPAAMLQAKKTRLSAALNLLGKVQPKKAICFILSDFRTPSCEKQIRWLAKKHDLIGIFISDPGELNPPQKGLWQLHTLETGETSLVDMGSDTFRSELSRHQQERLAKTEHLFRSSGADFLHIENDGSYSKTLRQFFRNRTKRRK
jgi:uncharacterized protein (DUF58 family)